MEYRSIRKLSFEYQGKMAMLETRYDERMRGDSTVRLPLNNGDYPMFFVVTPELLNLIADIYKKNTQLLWLHNDVPVVALQQYVRNILIDEIGLTNEMENVHSTRREIEDSLYSVTRNTPKKNVRFAGMVRKYDRLLHNDVVKLETCQDIRTLYDELVLSEVLRENPKDAPDGEIFRKDRVFVNRKGREIHEGSFPESRIIIDMERSLSVLTNEHINELIRVAVFHYLFAFIHPFYNGNGRMTRFISSYLISRELSPLAALRLSAVIKENLSKYYNMFKDANEKRNRGDLTEFVLAFLGFVKDSLDNCIESIDEKFSMLMRIGQLCEENDIDLDSRPVLWILIQNALFSDSGLSIEELIGHSGKGRSSVDKELQFCKTQWDALRTEKQGKRNIHRLDIDKLLALFSKDE